VYTCGEGANVESLARQACEFSVVDDTNIGIKQLCLTSVGSTATLTQFAKNHSTASDLWNCLPCYCKEEAASLEAATRKQTRKQSASEEWKQQRVGHITASKVHSARVGP